MAANSMATRSRSCLSKWDTSFHEDDRVGRAKLEESHQWQPTPVFLPKNPMDRGAWWAAVHGVTQSQTRLKQFSMHALEKEMEIGRAHV